jgi:hypothetical protein
MMRYLPAAEILVRHYEIRLWISSLLLYDDMI